MQIQMHHQPLSQTEQEYSLPENNNADGLKVKSEPKQLEDSVQASCEEEHLQVGHIQNQEQSKHLGELLTEHLKGEKERDVSDFGNYIVKVVEGENTRKIQCIICGKLSRDRNAAVRHVENSHFPGTFEYQCDQCDRKFDTKIKWASHRSDKHSKAKSDNALKKAKDQFSSN